MNLHLFLKTAILRVTSGSDNGSDGKSQEQGSKLSIYFIRESVDEKGLVPFFLCSYQVFPTPFIYLFLFFSF